MIDTTKKLKTDWKEVLVGYKKIEIELDYQKARNKRAFFVVATYILGIMGLFVFVAGCYWLTKSGFKNDGTWMLVSGIIALLLFPITLSKWINTRKAMKEFRKKDIANFSNHSNENVKKYGIDKD